MRFLITGGRAFRGSILRTKPPPFVFCLEMRRRAKRSTWLRRRYFHNVEFGRILGKVMRRPYWLPAPAFALRLLLGEMSTLVLDGQYLAPRRLLEMGFQFRFENAEEALRELLFSRESQ